MFEDDGDAMVLQSAIQHKSAMAIDMAAFRANPPDCTIVDPPYSKHVHKSAISQSVEGGTRSRNLGFDHLSPKLRRRICAFAAATRRWSCIYSDVESLTWWRLSLEAAGAQYIRSIPWVRWSAPQLSGDRPPTGCEMLIVAHGAGATKIRWNGPGNLLSFQHTCLRGAEKHKAEKPLDQLLDVVTYFSDAGEQVFDPCSGSGTTGTACAILGRRFVGLEIDVHWVEYANRRIRGACGVPGAYGVPDGATFDLDDRDKKRLEKWRASAAEQLADKARMKRHTAGVRAKADAKKLGRLLPPDNDSGGFHR
jgi:site-specific DNA-methyltransferase (adenine-specific)